MFMWSDFILFGSLASAFIFVTVRWFTNSTPSRLGWFIPGEAKFDPKSSWISNTTLLGTVLVAAFKDFKELNAPIDVSNLNILFLALAALALLLAMATVRLFSPIQHGTRVWLFLVSAGIALWAAIGQMFTLSYVICEAPTEAISGSSKVVFVGVVIIAAIALGAYAWTIMHDQIAKAVPPPPPQQPGVAPDATTTGPEWPFL
jgi:hypothetical protein